jgi:hypothetical protein
MPVVALFTEASLFAPHCLRLLKFRRDHAAWHHERQGADVFR